MNHEEKHFKGSETVKDIVIGMSDGLTVPFALAAGLSGAVSDNKIILTAGIAEIIAGSIAMGLGGYLAGKSEADHFESELRREIFEVDHMPEKEEQEIRDILSEYGISSETGNQVVKELSSNKKKWIDFMMKFELGLEKPEPGRATKSAGTIAASYIVGGIIPLSPYFFFSTPSQGLNASIVVTIIILFVFGYIKTKFIGEKPLAGAFRTVMIGTLAAAAAFLIAKWVR